MWSRLDDGWWKNRKLRARTTRAARGLLADLISFCGDERTDGFVPIASLPQLEASLTDPDLKVLIKGRLLHKRGDTCACIDNRAWTWPPDERGLLIHDFLDYNPSKAENEVVKAQRAELRDPQLRQHVRDRDFGRCRYCGQHADPKNRSGNGGETLDHIDPSIAAGAANLVIACRGCNSAKKKRTPAQALMTLIDLDEIRAKHFANLGIADPDLAQNSTPTQLGQADAPGRVGSGSGQVDSTQIGPPATIRGSVTPNPYTKAGHGDPSLEPPPPEPVIRSNSPPRTGNPPSRQPRNRKGRR